MIAHGRGLLVASYGWILSYCSRAWAWGTKQKADWDRSLLLSFSLSLKAFDHFFAIIHFHSAWYYVNVGLLLYLLVCCRSWVHYVNCSVLHCWWSRGCEIVWLWQHTGPEQGGFETLSETWHFTLSCFNIGCKFDHPMAPLERVRTLVTRRRHLFPY